MIVTKKMRDLLTVELNDNLKVAVEQGLNSGQAILVDTDFFAQKRRTILSFDSK